MQGTQVSSKVKKAVMSIANKILKNTSADAVAKIVNIVSLMILTPIIYKYLGTELYGLWSISFILIDYTAFADFGIGQSFVKFVAEYYAKNDKASLNKILNVGFFFYMGICSLLFAAALLFIDPVITRLLKVPDTYFHIAKTSMLICYGSMMFSLVFSCFNGYLSGIQRMELTAVSQVASRSVNFMGAFVVIYLDFGVIGLAVNAGFSIMVMSAMCYYFSRKLFPEMRISIFLFERQMFKHMFNYGYKLQIITLINKVIQSGITTIISNIIGLSAVGYFNIAKRMLNFVILIPSFLFPSLTPAISELNSQNRIEEIRKLYLRCFKYISFIGSFVICGALTIFPSFIFIWLGSSEKEIVYTFYILLIGELASIVFTGVFTSVLRGTGELNLMLVRTLTRLVILASMLVSFIEPFGYYGILGAHALSNIAASIMFYIAFSRYNHLNPIKVFSKALLLPLSLGFALAGAAFLLIGIEESTRHAAIIRFFSSGICFSLIYLFCILRLTQYLDVAEVKFLSDKFYHLKTKFSNILHCIAW